VTWFAGWIDTTAGEFTIRPGHRQKQTDAEVDEVMLESNGDGAGDDVDDRRRRWRRRRRRRRSRSRSRSRRRKGGGKGVSQCVMEETTSES
jgi:hypothetical protein